MADVSIGNAQVRLNTGSSWLARAGLRVKTSLSTRLGLLQPYGRVNLYHASGGTSTEAALGLTLGKQWVGSCGVQPRVDAMKADLLQHRRLQPTRRQWPSSNRGTAKRVGTTAA